MLQMLPSWMRTASPLWYQKCRLNEIIAPLKSRQKKFVKKAAAIFRTFKLKFERALESECHIKQQTQWRFQLRAPHNYCQYWKAEDTFVVYSRACSLSFDESSSTSCKCPTMGSSFSTCTCVYYVIKRWTISRRHVLAGSKKSGNNRWASTAAENVLDGLLLVLFLDSLVYWKWKFVLRAVTNMLDCEIARVCARFV